MRLLVFAFAVLASLAASAQDARPIETFVDCQGLRAGLRPGLFPDRGHVRPVRPRPPRSPRSTSSSWTRTPAAAATATRCCSRGRRGAFEGRRDTLVTTTAAGRFGRRPAAGAPEPAVAGAGRLREPVRAGEPPERELRRAGGHPTACPRSRPPRTPGTAWVFRIDGRGFFNGQAQSQSGGTCSARSRRRGSPRRSRSRSAPGPATTGARSSSPTAPRSRPTTRTTA